MKNVTEKYQSDKFRILALGIFMTQKYFNTLGVKYLAKVRIIAVILFLYTPFIITLYISKS